MQKSMFLLAWKKKIVGAWYVDNRVNKQIVKDAKKFAMDFLTKLKNKAEKAGISVSVNVLETRSISKQIVNFANSKKINLIVIGSPRTVRI